MLQAGTRLNDRYEIQSVLGEGGMGFVYLALDGAQGDEKVAVKEMAVHLHSEEEKPAALRQFRVEAELLGSLQHARLAPVRDFFEEGDNAYLVMSFIDGQTLAATMAEREVPLTEIAGWIDQICEVLEYLHGHEPPVLFCDLKPSNVMVDRDGQIWLIDFGIARAVKTEPGSSTFLKGAVTSAFAPLEQFSGKGTDARSDIYALGATMYNLLTGELPPISVDVVGGESAPAAPRAVNASIPLQLEAIVCKAMALRKEDRYQSVHELQCDLAEARAILEQGGLAEAPPPEGRAGSGDVAPPPPRRGVGRILSPLRRPLWFVAATVAAILWLLMAPRAATPGETHVSFTERLTPRAPHAPVTAPATVALSETPRPAHVSAPVPLSAAEAAPPLTAAFETPRPRPQTPAAKPAPPRASPAPSARTARAVAEDESPEERPAPQPTRVPRPVARHHAVEVETPAAEEHPVEVAEERTTDRRTAEDGQPRQRFSNPYAPSAEALASIPPPPHMRNIWMPCTDTTPALKVTGTKAPKPALRKLPRSPNHGHPLPAAPSATRTRSLDLLGVVVSQRGNTALVRIGNDFRYVGLGSHLGNWTVIEFNCRPPYKSDLVVQSNGVSRRVPLVPATADAGVPRPPTADEVPITGPAPAPPGPRKQPLEPPVDPRYFRP